MDIPSSYRKLTLKELQDAEQYVDSLFILLKNGRISDEQLAGDIKELISASRTSGEDDCATGRSASLNQR